MCLRESGGVEKISDIVFVKAIACTETDENNWLPNVICSVTGGKDSTEENKKKKNVYFCVLFVIVAKYFLVSFQMAFSAKWT